VTVEKALIDAADSTAGGIQIDRYPREKALRRNKVFTTGDDGKLIMP
jgi:hypothetical protein